MKIPVTALLIAAPLFLGAAAPSTARDRDAVPEATVTGPARSCIPLHAIRNSEVRNDGLIDFMTTRRKGYRVTLPDRCPGLGFERAFSYRTPLNQLCKQDIITVFRQGGGHMAGASCGLGEFQPIELVPQAR